MIIGAATLLGVAAAGWWLLMPQGDGPGTLPSDADTLAQGEAVYAQNCASCHGAALEGAPDWRVRDAEGMLPAPPHDATGHTWHHDSDALFGIVKHGVGKMIGDPAYKTNMPAYDGVLSDSEIIATLSYIRSTWPDEVRQAYDARESTK